MSARSNNPFAPSPPNAVQATANRFPDISGDPALSQNQQQQPQQQQYQQGYLQQQPTGYPQQQQQQYAPQQQPQQTSAYGPASSSFGLSAQPTGYSPSPSPYQQQPQYQQSTTSNQQQFQPFSVTDLDPYANLGSLQASGSAAGGAGASSRPLPQALASSPQHQSHPRQFVMENKAQLMSWDEYAWKQLLSRVDTLREAWESRKSAIQSVGNQGADPTAVDGLRKEADNYVDSIHAAKMQLAVVKEGWRHSTDPASKARVREALNAGLSSLPEYPPPLSPEQLGGQYHQRAWEDQRKSGIMSGYGAGQMQSQPTGYGGGGGMQSQPTGYGGGYGGGMQPQQTGYGGAGGYGGQQQQGYQSQQTGFGGVQPQQTGYGAFGGQQQGYPGGGQYYG